MAKKSRTSKKPSRKYIVKSVVIFPEQQKKIDEGTAFIAKHFRLPGGELQSAFIRAAIDAYDYTKFPQVK